MSTGEPRHATREPLRLHIGGVQVKEGWKILNSQPKPGVDFLGNCVDLSQFGEGTVDEIYASHVYEHLGHRTDLPKALNEAHRVLRPGGMIRVGVPDMETLCRLFLRPGATTEWRFYVQCMMMGGQMDEYDFHRSAFDFDILKTHLEDSGFRYVQRVKSFGLFHDTTELIVEGFRVSLNVMAMK